MPSPAPPRSPWDDTSPLQIRTHLLRAVFSWLPPDDPWTKVEHSVDWPRLVRAAPTNFRLYFAGQLMAPANSLEGVCDWLFGCRYRADKLVGDGADKWAHPVEFEKCRQGDCEDFALWAWRRLAEIGYAAEFVVGLLDREPKQLTVNHAWVHVHDRGQLWVLEPTAIRRAEMLCTPDAARRRYIPTASIDHQFRTFWFANLFHVRAHGAALGPPALPRSASRSATAASPR